MAAPICVSFKSNVKEIFDPKHKAAVLKQLAQAIKIGVGKSSALELSDSPCKTGFLLTVNVSVTSDSKTAPTSVEAKVSIDGVSVGGTGRGFKAASKAKATGINANKMEEEAKFVTNEAATEVLKRAVAEMSK